MLWRRCWYDDTASMFEEERETYKLPTISQEVESLAV